MFIATFALPAKGFALGHTLEAASEMAVKAERVAAHGTTWVMPCLWAAGGDFAVFERALEDDPTVVRVVDREEFDEEKYYQIGWSDSVSQFVDALIDSEASVLNAEAENGEWQLRIRFGTRNQLETFQEYLAHQHHGFQLLDLINPSAPRQERGELSAPQRDALVTAVEQGYFRIPRESTMDEIADELEISSQSASERLRRGVEHLVTNVLVTPEE